MVSRVIELEYDLLMGLSALNVIVSDLSLGHLCGLRCQSLSCIAETKSANEHHTFLAIVLMFITVRIESSLDRKQLSLSSIGNDLCMFPC